MNKIWISSTLLLALLLTALLVTAFTTDDAKPKEYVRLTITQGESRAVVVYPNGKAVEHELPRLSKRDIDVNKKTTELINDLAKEGYTLVSASMASVPDRSVSNEIYLFEK